MSNGWPAVSSISTWRRREFFCPILHVVTPDGGHAWYGNRVLKDGGALDVDVTTGYGPEIFSSAAPPKGNYHAYVNYYGSGADTSTLTVARISIITNEGTSREKLQSFQVPMRAAGEIVRVPVDSPTFALAEPPRLCYSSPPRKTVHTKQGVA